MKVYLGCLKFLASSVGNWCSKRAPRRRQTSRARSGRGSLEGEEWGDEREGSLKFSILASSEDVPGVYTSRRCSRLVFVAKSGRIRRLIYRPVCRPRGADFFHCATVVWRRMRTAVAVARKTCQRLDTTNRDCSFEAERGAINHRVRARVSHTNGNTKELLLDKLHVSHNESPRADKSDSALPIGE